MERAVDPWSLCQHFLYWSWSCLGSRVGLVKGNPCSDYERRILDAFSPCRRCRLLRSHPLATGTQTDRKPGSGQQPRAPAEPANISPPKWGREDSFAFITKAFSLLLLHECICFSRKALCCYDSFWLKRRALLSAAFCLKR